MEIAPEALLLAAVCCGGVPCCWLVPGGGSRRRGGKSAGIFPIRLLLQRDFVSRGRRAPYATSQVGVQKVVA